MKKYKKINNLQKVLSHFGSILNLSIHLNIKRQSIYGWKKIPEKQAYRIEKLTNGKIKASDLGHNL